ncbi:hypothetical protein METP3_00993 [Methanosarcinales archaeon]|nr:hypothetical protein METP3_00993 [Methanosarcinales archaeon]
MIFFDLSGFHPITIRARVVYRIPQSSVHLSRSVAPSNLTEFIPERAPCASLLIRDAVFHRTRRIKHNISQATARLPEQDPSNDLPQRACGHTSARGLREFDAAASHPRTTKRSCKPCWKFIFSYYNSNIYII